MENDTKHIQSLNVHPFEYLWKLSQVSLGMVVYLVNLQTQFNYKL